MKLFLSKNFFLLLLAGWTCTYGHAHTNPSPGFASAETEDRQERSRLFQGKELHNPQGRNSRRLFQATGPITRRKTELSIQKTRFTR